MKIPTVRRILKEDLSGGGEELPGWLDQMLDPLNSFIDTITLALRGKITLADNLSGKMVTVDLTHDTPLDINPAPLKTRVTGLIPLSFGEQILVGYSWRIKDNGFVEVRFRYGAGSGTASCTFFLLAG